MLIILPAIAILIAATQPGAPLTSPDSAAVSKRLDAARQIAIDLRADAAEMLAAARSNTDGRVWLPNGEKIKHDIRDLNETSNELLEMEQMASPRQKTIINRVRPLMRDLAHNTQLPKEHVEGGPGESRAGTYDDYVSAHEEMSRGLASQIVEFLEHSHAAQSGRPAK